MAMFNRLLRLGDRGLNQRSVITKRWSGHNAMDITPSSLDMKYTTNWVHFYIVLAGVPIIAFTTYINIRANPELTETPEGYEPRHFEYFKHPISRWMARYMLNSNDLEREVMMGIKEDIGQEMIAENISKKCEKVMRFYNDHRSFHFIPYFAQYFRAGRDEALFKYNFEATNPNTIIDLAYDPNIRNPVPTEGYPANFDPTNFK